MKTERKRCSWLESKQGETPQATNNIQEHQGLTSHGVGALQVTFRPRIDRVPNMDQCHAVAILQFLITFEQGFCFSLHGDLSDYIANSEYRFIISSQYPESKVSLVDLREVH